MIPLAFAWLAAGSFAASLAYFLYVYLFVFGPAPFASGPALSALAQAPSASVPAASWGLNLVLFSAFALHHSVLARSGAKEYVRTFVPPALERATYVLVASILFVLVCRYWRPVPGIAWTLEGIWRQAGYAVQLAGIVLTIAGARALDVWELAGVRQVQPDSQRPVVLKTDGLYGFVRHPLYFAWMLLVFGSPDMTMTRLSFATISTIYLVVAIPFEERSLIETFGPDYASYREKVRWRMLPGIW